MTNPKEQQLQAFARRAARVSQALWPTNVRHSIATSRAAQTRRQLIIKSRWWRWPPRFKPGRKPGRAQSQPNPPLVRVLETFDLSQTSIEHFLDLPDGGDTGAYSLESWKEAQMK